MHSKHSISLYPIHNHRKIQRTVNEKIPGAGMLQSPIVACLNKEYQASLYSFDTVLAGCHERINLAVSLNFFYQLSPIFNNIPLIQTLDSLIDRNNENLDFNKHTKVQNPTTSTIKRQTHPNKSSLPFMLLLLQLLLL